MPRYAVRAVDSSGRSFLREIEAPTIQFAESQLEAEGHLVIEISERPPAARVNPPRRNVKKREVLLFTLHLDTVFASGIPVTEGLRDFLSRLPAQNPMRLVVEDMLLAVEEGNALSQAMARHPAVFSDLYVNLIRAGETGGYVETVLKELAQFMEWQEGLKSQIKQALVYPAILLSAIGLLTIYLFAFVFPKFVGLLTKSGVPVPLPTRIVMGTGNFLQSYGPELLILGIVLAIAFQLFRSSPMGAWRIDAWMLRLPIIGDLLLKVALSRFAHHLEALYGAGVDFIQSLEAVEKAVGNRAVARAVRRLRERVLEGITLGAAVAEVGVFSPLVVRMVAMGDVSGRLEESLAKVAQYYDQEVPASVKRMMAFIEPMVIGLLAAVVLGAALTVYLPIYSLISSLQPGRSR